MNVAFIGLGVMGYPMAGHLVRTGHRVTVFNRTPGRAALWCDEFGGASAPTPAEAVAGAEVVAVCVGNDDDVRQVLVGESGVLEGIAPGSLLVDHTTASAELAREMAQRCDDLEVGFVDAPVSGGQAGAEGGTLTIMCGGDEEDFQRAGPVLEAYARCVRRLGGPGAGQLAKMVNQICIAGVVQGLSEAMLFSEKAGLDTADVIEVISQGAAQSWQMENRYLTMLAGEYEHGFAVDWMRKDLAIVAGEARRMGLSLPVAELVDSYYGDVQELGGGRWDTSSLFARLRHQHDSPGE